MATRDFLRSVTLGAASRQFRSRLVVIRDPSQPKRLEDVLDEEGKPVLEQKLDARGKPDFDDEGKPIMVVKQRYRFPPRLDDAGDWVRLEVREPTIKLRSEIYRSAGITGERDGSGIDMAALQVSAVIACTYEPGTQVKVFAETDRPALLAQPPGTFVDDLFEALQPLMNVDEKVVEKN